MAMCFSVGKFQGCGTVACRDCLFYSHPRVTKGKGPGETASFDEEVIRVEWKSGTYCKNCKDKRSAAIDEEANSQLKFCCFVLTVIILVSVVSALTP